MQDQLILRRRTVYPFFLPLAYWKALQISGMFLNYFKQFGGVGGVEHETIYFIRSADNGSLPLHIYIYKHIYIFFNTSAPAAR